MTAQPPESPARKPSPTVTYALAQCQLYTDADLHTALRRANLGLPMFEGPPYARNPERMKRIQIRHELVTRGLILKGPYHRFPWIITPAGAALLLSLRAGLTSDIRAKLAPN